MARSVNGNVQVVAGHFGHSLEVAMRHYVQPVDIDTQRAALALDGALAASNEGQTRDGN